MEFKESPLSEQLGDDDGLDSPLANGATAPLLRCLFLFNESHKLSTYF